MPSASANISAKFIAQIEMSKPCVPRYSEPGGGDQAEDREHQRQPGGDERAEGEHEDHQRDRPGEQLGLHHRRAVGLVEVRPHARGAGQRDLHAVAPAACSSVLRSSAARDHRVGVAAAPAMHDRGVAVARDRRARAAAPRPARRAGRRAGRARRAATVCRNAGSATVWRGECTTTISAELERPPKLRSISVARLRRTREPVASQPAPESAFSTLGAKKPSADGDEQPRRSRRRGSGRRSSGRAGRSGRP